MQVVARHAYALTYEREYVQQWAEEQMAGQWGGDHVEDDLEHDRAGLKAK